MRIGIIVVAYNAASTLAKVLDRIPAAFIPKIADVVICDNASEDHTYLVGLGYKQVKGTTLPLTVIRNDSNRGYGGNQKVGYQWAIDHDIDIVVLLHADGQYAPEFLDQIVAPLERGEADAVFGSRMMTPGGARRGRMPLYKVIGNKTLTAFENRVAGAELSEWHSGYRAYRVDALRRIPFQANSDEYNFDTEIILQLLEAGMRIHEIPIPTYYGEEISYVNGTRYAKDIVLDVLRYRAYKAGLGSGRSTFAQASGSVAQGPGSARDRAVRWLDAARPGRTLVVGRPSDELVARVAAVSGEVDVVGTDDLAEQPTGASHYDRILIPDSLAGADDPVAVMRAAAERLTESGSIVVTVANFGHWHPRARAVTGRFAYDDSGAFAVSQPRLFTDRMLIDLAAEAGLAVRRRERIGRPDPDGRRAPITSALRSAALAASPGLFAYQLIYELEASRPTG